MPGQAIIIAAVFVTVAVGIVVYENREHIPEFVEKSKRKWSEVVGRVREEVRRNQNRMEEIPLAGRRLSVSSNGTVDERNPFADPSSTVTGRDVGQAGAELRRRGAPGGSYYDGRASSPSDALSTSSHGASINQSRRSSSATLSAVPVASLPPTSAPASGVPVESPFEDAYESRDQSTENHNTEEASAVSSSSGIISAASEVHSIPQQQQQQQQPYWNIPEWAGNATEQAANNVDRSSSPSLAGSDIEVDRMSDSGSDVASDVGSNPESVRSLGSAGSEDSWMDVGSVLSGEH